MARINGKKVLSVVKTQAVAVNIEANPAGAATETLEKLKIDNTIYGVEGGGSNVEANPTDTASAALTKLKVNSNTYSVPSALSDLSDDATHRVVTDTEKTTWNGKSDFSGSYNDLSNKPTIPSALSELSQDASHQVVTAAEKTTWNNKSNFSGSYNDLSNKPTIPSALSELSQDAAHQVVTAAEKTTWNNKSNFSGSYNDLTNKPTIPAEQVQADWNESDTNSKAYIQNKPTIPTVPTYYQHNIYISVTNTQHYEKVKITLQIINQSNDELNTGAKLLDAIFNNGIITANGYAINKTFTPSILCNVYGVESMVKQYSVRAFTLYAYDAYDNSVNNTLSDNEIPTVIDTVTTI